MLLEIKLAFFWLLTADVFCNFENGQNIWHALVISIVDLPNLRCLSGPIYQGWSLLFIVICFHRILEGDYVRHV